MIEPLLGLEPHDFKRLTNSTLVLGLHGKKDEIAKGTIHAYSPHNDNVTVPVCRSKKECLRPPHYLWSQSRLRFLWNIGESDELKAKKAELAKTKFYYDGVQRIGRHAARFILDADPMFVIGDIREQTIRLFNERYPDATMCEKCAEIAAAPFELSFVLPSVLTDEAYNYTIAHESWRNYQLSDVFFSDHQGEFLYEPYDPHSKRHRAAAQYRVDDKVIVGVRLTHAHNVEGNECSMVLMFGECDYSVISLAPLTIMPSVQCPYCQCHGWVRNGYWEELEPVYAIQSRQRVAKTNHLTLGQNKKVKVNKK